MKAPRITKQEFKRKLDEMEDLSILDVRNPVDYAGSNLKIPGAIRVPLENLEASVSKFDPSKEVVTYCT